jgi:crotonobetainyl-CoA:carnitine CoA-transferase CaiB-like acyl-CoA transferase
VTQGDPAPLADLRVLAIEQYGAGPWGTMQLADLGADVIKIEDPRTGGDVGRYVPPYQDGSDSLFFESFNRGKRSVMLDLRTEAGLAAFHGLVGGADAVFSNLRGDGPERLGLRYADLRHLNEQLVCCSLSAFGTDGPRRTEGGYDFTIQGLAGWQSLTGGPDQLPMRSGLSLVDLSAGYVAAIAILAAVWRARRLGVGGDVDLSLFETALAQLTYFGTWVASRGYEPMRRERSAHQSIIPFGNYPTADDWIVIACPKQSLWNAFCEAVERPEWAVDPRFATFADRDRHRDVLTTLIDERLRAQGAARWLSRLTKAGVPCAPINDVATALSDPQILARGGIVDYSHPHLERVRQVRTPFRMAGVNPKSRPAPHLGEDTQALLEQIESGRPSTTSTVNSPDKPTNRSTGST